MEKWRKEKERVSESVITLLQWYGSKNVGSETVCILLERCWYPWHDKWYRTAEKRMYRMLCYVSIWTFKLCLHTNSQGEGETDTHTWNIECGLRFIHMEQILFKINISKGDATIKSSRSSVTWTKYYEIWYIYLKILSTCHKILTTQNFKYWRTCS